MNSIKKHKSLIATLAMCGVAVAYVVFFFLPGQEATKALGNQLQDKRASIATAAYTKASIMRLENELEHARQFTQQWKDHAPVEARMPQAFGTIYESTQHSGATITKFEPQDSTAMQTVHRVPLLLTSRGTYEQISETLLSLEQLPMTVWFDSLRFTPSRENAQDITCEEPRLFLRIKPVIPISLSLLATDRKEAGSKREHS